MQKLQALPAPPPTRMLYSLPVTTATAMDTAQRGTCILHCAQPSCWSQIHCSCRSTCGEFLLYPSCWHALWSIVYKLLAGEACVRSGCCERSRVRLAATVCRIGWWSQVSAVRFCFCLFLSYCFLLPHVQTCSVGRAGTRHWQQLRCCRWRSSCR